MANFNFSSNAPLPPTMSSENRPTFPIAGNNTQEARNIPPAPFPDFGARSPPKGTPSSYGKFIQKRGRVGSGAGFGGGGGMSGTSGDKSRTSTSLSGRLRSVSDLERSGIVTSSEKGRLKDLIIAGDDSLRSALEKYEGGDHTELEGLIARGHLAQSNDVDNVFDASELDMLDLGSLGLDGTDFLGMFDMDRRQSIGSNSSFQGQGGINARRRTFSGTANNLHFNMGIGGGPQSSGGVNMNQFQGGGGNNTVFQASQTTTTTTTVTATTSNPNLPSNMNESNMHYSSNQQQHLLQQQQMGGGLGMNPTRKDSAGWDYDFGNVSGVNTNEPFEMDDLGFGGLDTMVDIMPNQHHNQQHHNQPHSELNELASVLSINPGLTNGTTQPRRQGGGGGQNNQDHQSSSNNFNSKSSNNMLPPNNGQGNSGGGGGGSRRGGNQGGSSSSSTLMISSSGTVNFPNSTNSGNRFPTSNCVAELPPLQSLPPGQAPAYEQLINFQRAKSKDAVRCVMCGSAPTEGEHGTVIPQQNKDVCRDCDKALWVHGETRTYFKWCKGCKRFRNIVAFSEKLDASKCNSCRERGRRSYLQRKGIGGVSGNGSGGGGLNEGIIDDELNMDENLVTSGVPSGDDIGGGLTFSIPEPPTNERFDIDC